jgi:hypothetical protein
VRIGHEELGPWRDAFRPPAPAWNDRAEDEPAHPASPRSEVAELCAENNTLREENVELRTANDELRKELDVLMQGLSAWVQNLAGRTG